MGAPATIVSRTVIVSAFFKPGCNKVEIRGRQNGQHHDNKMGDYELMYSRCEANYDSGTINDKPTGRCVAVTDEGSPIYKQLDGPNFMYYHPYTMSWHVDVDATGKSKKGLRIMSKARKPEDIEDGSTWKMSTKDGRWVDVEGIKLSCSHLHLTLPKFFDYFVTADIEVSGMTKASFKGGEQKKFIASLSDALDVRIEDIQITKMTDKTLEDIIKDSANTNNRRLRENSKDWGDAAQKPMSREDKAQAMAQTASSITNAMGGVEVEFTVTNTEAKLDSNIVPILKETEFSNILAAEMRSEGLSPGLITVESTKIERPKMTTAAILRKSTFYAMLAGIGLGGALFAFAAHKLIQFQRKKLSGSNLSVDGETDGASAEERKGLTGGSL